MTEYLDEDDTEFLEDLVRNNKDELKDSPIVRLAQILLKLSKSIT